MRAAAHRLAAGKVGAAFLALFHGFADHGLGIFAAALVAPELLELIALLNGKRDCATRCSAFRAVCMFYVIGFVLDG